MHSEFAPAKVNLHLHVTGRRADGYHLLDSLAVFPAVGDTLRATPAEGLSLALEGPFAAGLTADDDNLVLRAARALAASCGLPPSGRLVLEKRLPIASGIGGGSADAAATLRLLARLWGVALDKPRLHAIAGGLGADVPVCLDSRPARMGGVGEALGPAPTLPSCGIALVNPGVAVSTPDVFRARSGDFSAAAALPAGWADALAMARDLAALRNDLEVPAIGLAPVIADVLAALRDQAGCLLARMSGSGATCFALFATEAEADRASKAVARPEWWCWGGGLAR